MKLVVVGSVAYDSIETPSEKRDKVLGGSAVYFSAAASQFAPAGIVGVVGEDYVMDDLKFLAEKGVDLSGIEVAGGKTFFWRGRYFDNMNQRETLETQLNVFENFKPVIPEKFRDAAFLFLGNIHPALQLDVLDQVKKPDYVLLDTMNLWINTELDLLGKVIARVDGLIVNDEEARQLTGETNLIRAARGLAKMGPGHVIVKKGEHGAFQLHDGALFFVPAYPTDSVVDPTGAGDSFAGGVMGRLAREGRRDDGAFRQALVYGTLMASFCVEGFSMERLGPVKEQEVRERFEAFRAMLRIE